VQVKVTDQQITEWTENPVTLAFKDLADEAISILIASKENCYHQFQPEKTHEVMAVLHTAQDTWETVINSLEGEGLWWELDESGNDASQTEPET